MSSSHLVGARNHPLWWRVRPRDGTQDRAHRALVVLGHDVVSAGEWSLLQSLVHADLVLHTELVRELKASSGLVLNRFGLLDTVDADAVRSVERLYRAAAEENRVEPIWDPEEADVESVAVFVEPRFLPPLE